MTIQDWAEVLATSLRQVWDGFIGFVPALIGAIIVLIIGAIVASGLGHLVERLIGAMKLDSIVAKAGVERYFKRAGINLNIGRFFGRLTHWFVVIAFFLAAADILQFRALSVFLQSILLYIPQVVVATLIMLAAFVVGNFLRKAVEASVRSADLHGARFLGTLSWWAVVVFGFLASLAQLGIAVSIINTLVTGFVVMLALAGGIAFGLGGKDYAAHLLGRFRDNVEGK